MIDYSVSNIDVAASKLQNLKHGHLDIQPVSTEDLNDLLSPSVYKLCYVCRRPVSAEHYDVTKRTFWI